MSSAGRIALDEPVYHRPSGLSNLFGGSSLVPTKSSPHPPVASNSSQQPNTTHWVTDTEETGKMDDWLDHLHLPSENELDVTMSPMAWLFDEQGKSTDKADQSVMGDTPGGGSKLFPADEGYCSGNEQEDDIDMVNDSPSEDDWAEWDWELEMETT